MPFVKDHLNIIKYIEIEGCYLKRKIFNVYQFHSWEYMRITLMRIHEWAKSIPMFDTRLRNN